MHPWHRYFYGPRVFHMTTTAVVSLLLWREGHLPAQRAIVLAVVLGVWPHVIRWVAPRIDPSKRGVFGSMFADVTMFGLFAPFVGWTWPLIGPSLVAMTVNPLATGGPRVMLLSFGVFAVAAAMGQLALPLASPDLAQGGLYSGGTAILQTVLYAGLIAFRAHQVSKRLSQQRRELQELRDHLEDLVEERTAALASTNRAISRFVPTEFLHALGHEDVRSAELGDVISRDLTILFADIRNFTTLSEQMTPEQTFSFLNECLSRLGPHIRNQSGFIDKYIGDAIMALFPRSPDSAVRAAISMLQEVRTQNARFPHLPPLSIGVGIHFGPVMMGTIGEEERFEATVISDAVNLTARLESLTKQLGCSILISKEVADQIEDAQTVAEIRFLGAFAVKGRSQPVEIFEAFGGEAEDARAKKRGSRDLLKEGIEQYGKGSFDEAYSVFANLVEKNPDDGPARWWMERVRSDCDAETGAGGVIRLKDK